MNKFGGKILTILVFVFCLISCGGGGSGDSGTGNPTEGIGKAYTDLINKKLVLTVDTCTDKSDGAITLVKGQTMTLQFISSYRVFGAGLNRLPIDDWEYDYSGANGEINLHYPNGDEEIKLTATNPRGDVGTFTYHGALSSGNFAEYTGAYEFKGVYSADVSTGDFSSGLETPASKTSEEFIDIEGRVASMQFPTGISPDVGGAVKSTNLFKESPNGDQYIFLNKNGTDVLTSKFNAKGLLDTNYIEEITGYQATDFVINDDGSVFVAVTTREVHGVIKLDENGDQVIPFGGNESGFVEVIDDDEWINTNTSSIPAFYIEPEPNGGLYAVGCSNGLSQLSLITSEGQITKQVSLSSAYPLYYPYAIGVDGLGNLYVASTDEYRTKISVCKFTPSLTLATSYGSSGCAQWNDPFVVTDMAVGEGGGVVIVGWDSISGTVPIRLQMHVATFDATGTVVDGFTFASTMTGNNDAIYDMPQAVTLDDEGNVYITGYSKYTYTSQNYAFNTGETITRYDTVMRLWKYNSDNQLVWGVTDQHNSITAGFALYLDDTDTIHLLGVSKDSTGTTSATVWEYVQ